MKTKTYLVKTVFGILTLVCLACFIYLGMEEKEITLDSIPFLYATGLFLVLYFLFRLVNWGIEKNTKNRVKKAKNFYQLYSAFLRYVSVFNYEGTQFPRRFVNKAKSLDLNSLCPEELVAGFENFNSIVGKQIFEKLQKESKNATTFKAIRLKSSLIGSSLENAFDKNFKESLKKQETALLLSEPDQTIMPWVVEIIGARLSEHHDLLPKINTFMKNNINSREKDKYVEQVFGLALEDIICEFSIDELKEASENLPESSIIKCMIRTELGTRILNEKFLPEKTPENHEDVKETSQEETSEEENN